MREKNGGEGRTCSQANEAEPNKMLLSPVVKEVTVPTGAGVFSFQAGQTTSPEDEHQVPAPGPDRGVNDLVYGVRLVM